MERQRVARVAEQVRAETADILRGMKDPRMGFASVVRAEMSPDLRYAKVYVSVLGPEAEREETMAVLERAKGHVRSELGRRIRLYHTPELRFIMDDSLAHGDRIARILRDLDPSAEAPSEPSTPEP